MAREEYDVVVSPWRHTALQPMLWFIEFYAVLPIMLWIVDIGWSTFYLALGCILLLLFQQKSLILGIHLGLELEH